MKHVAVGPKVGAVLNDSTRPLPELIKRLAVARNLLEVWFNAYSDEPDWAPQIAQTTGLVDEATTLLKSADDWQSRASYKEAGKSFSALWAGLSQSDVPPSVIEHTAEVIKNAATVISLGASIGLGTILLCLGAIYLVTRRD